ncbi:MAG: Fis family transcriptional regulator [Gammaproteobacteria bacterium]|nr:Fis family transcriptional regulator [Gammaproteobacteria bacterium]|tara:strand:- start:5129 stop:5371 length:243 start_codon:yes stop_codon:yes gene_type:complete
MHKKNNIVLKDVVRSTIREYFEKTNGHQIKGTYNFVMNEVEKPLIEETMSFCSGNQSKASIILGINRGTLRKKLKQYNID